MSTIRRIDNQGTLLPVIQNDGKTDPIPEMRAYDQLGPLTRRAIDNFPISFSSEKTLDMIRSQRMDPKNRYMDAQVANQIKSMQETVEQAMRDEYENMPILNIR